MRVAPIGLFAHTYEDVFEHGCEIAQITHGHPSGYLAAGCFAFIIAEIIKGKSLEEAIRESMYHLMRKEGHEECRRAIERAVKLSREAEPCPETIESMGAGWVAEEALPISFYCSLVYKDDINKAVLLAVNHSGDSDSTGAVTGNIVGALLGKKAIPKKWLTGLELRSVIEELAADLLTGYKEDEAWRAKYPCR